MKKFLILILICFCFILTGCDKNEIAPVSQIAVNEIVINKSYAYVNVGDKIILSAQVYPFNADNQNVLWKTDNPKIAEVDGGIVIGNSEGRTVITCISEDGEKEDKCILYVSTPKLDYSKYQNNLTSTQNRFEKYAPLNSSQNLEKDNEQNNEEYEIFQDNILQKDFDFINLINNQFKKFDELFDNIKEYNNNLIEKLKDKTNFKEISNLDRIDNNESNFYAYEYQYNSNGIVDEEDENTIYKDENTIVKEYCSKIN